MKNKADDSNICICRCEEVSLEEIRNLINQGYTDFNEIKGILRVGMGPCQGRTCRPLILREIARATGKSIEEINLTSYRPPSKPIKISIIGGNINEK